MTNQEFFARLMPREGRLAMCKLPQGQHTFFNSPADMAAAADAQAGTTGRYFSPAAYDEDSRKQSHVRAVRAFWLDIDAGTAKYSKDPKGVYPTREDALAGLVEFMRTTDLRPAFIVSSGEGLHVYFCLTDEVPRGEWQAVADQLKAVTKAVGLRADPTCTADSARILRVPGSMHGNGSIVRILRSSQTTYSLDDFAAKLAPHLPAAEADFTDGRVFDLSVNDDLVSGGIDDRPASLARVAEHCAVVADMRDRQGCVPEPQWRAVLGIAKFCPGDGETLAHEWSSGYEGYSRRETQAKIEHWGTPPPTCAALENIAGKCAGCPHKGKITTPVQLGREPRAARPDAPVLPAAQVAMMRGTPDDPIPHRPDLMSDESPFFYQRNDEGKWVLYAANRVKEQDEDGDDMWVVNTRPLAERMFWLDHASAAGEQDGDGVQVQLCVLVNEERVAIERYRLSAGDLYDERGIERTLLKWAVPISSKTRDARSRIKTFLLAEYARIVRDMRPVSRGRFGLQTHEDEVIATLGGTAIYADGHMQSAMYGPSLAAVGNSLGIRGLPPSPNGYWGPDIIDTYIAPGAARYAQHLADHYMDDDQSVARLAIAVGLAAPLFVFCADDPYTGQHKLPPTGLLVSLYGRESGRGKSAVLRTIAAAYGDTSQVRPGNSANITVNAMENLAKVTAQFPFLLDEVSLSASSHSALMAYNFANGFAKVRSTQDGSVRSADVTWALPCLITTNVPQRDIVQAVMAQSSAMQLRVMELDFDTVAMREQDGRYIESMANLSPVYGTFGALLLHRLLNNMDTIGAAARSHVTKAFTDFDMSQDYRFFARAVAAVNLLFDLMGDVLPFTREDIHAALAQSIAELKDFQENNIHTPVGTFNEFISFIGSHVAVTNTMDDGSVVQNINKLQSPVWGREVRNEGHMYVSPRAVVKFAQETGRSKTQLERDWAKAGLLILNRNRNRWPINPFRGMPFVARETECLRFNVRDPAKSATGTVVPLTPANKPEVPTAQEKTA